MTTRESDYEKAPEVPLRLRGLFEAVMAVHAGKMTVTEAALQVGLSRNRFQTRMHRGLDGLVKGLDTKPQGRPAKPAREAELEEKVRRLEKENARLRERVEMVDRMLGVASDLVRGRVKLSGRQTGASPSPETPHDNSEEPDGEARARLEGARALRMLGLSGVLIAALVGRCPSTLRRHAQRERLGARLVNPRGPRCARPPADETKAAGAAAVRQLAGQIGADALSHVVPGLSRRQAAAVKNETVTQMERERKAACERIAITVPGIMRGFDAMHVGDNYLLVGADACVPYRTLISAVSEYDSAAVAAAIELDIALNGAPLVWRMDRARCQQTREVLEVLERHQVLLLHGPPRHPQYYAQLERQNREHRAMLNGCGALDLHHLAIEARRMQLLLNTRWPRRSLWWATPAEVWLRRGTLDEVDREALKEEVEDRAARLQRQLEVRGERADLANRLAIEATMMKYGWLIRRGARAEC